MDQNSTRLLNLTRLRNLTVLQRIDPFIEEILMTVDHVTFYEFNIEIFQWSPTYVEGSLFVVKRNKQQPRFQFIMMNRRNTDNLVEDLLGDLDYEVQGPYLLYRNAAKKVKGIWFYDKHECDEVACLFDRLLTACSKANQKPNTSSSKSEFQELEAVPPMAVMDGPLEPSSTARDAPNDPAFVNFFSSAMALGNTSSGSESRPPYQSSAIPLQPHQPTLAPSFRSMDLVKQLEVWTREVKEVKESIKTLREVIERKTNKIIDMIQEDKEMRSEINELAEKVLKSQEKILQQMKKKQ